MANIKDAPPPPAQEQASQGPPEPQPSPIFVIEADVEKRSHDGHGSVWVALPLSVANGAPVGAVQASDIFATYVLAASDLADRENDRTWDRVARLQVNTVSGELKYSAVDGPFVRFSATGTAWMRTAVAWLAGRAGQAGYRLAGPYAFLHGHATRRSLRLGQPQDLDERLPEACRPRRGALCFLALCALEVPMKGAAAPQTQVQMHSVRLTVSQHGHLTACRTHAWVRTKGGAAADLPAKDAELEVPLAPVRLITAGHADLPLLNGAVAPLPLQGTAARVDPRAALEYLDGPRAGPDPPAGAGGGAAGPEDGGGPMEKAAAAVRGYAPAAFARERDIVLLQGCVVLGPQHGQAPFAQLPLDCRPASRVQLLVARGPHDGVHLVQEVLQIDPDGSCSCPELHRPPLLGRALGAEADGVAILHLNGAAFGAAGDRCRQAAAGAPQVSDASRYMDSFSGRRLLKKVRPEELPRLCKFLTFLSRCDTKNSRRLTHSCFQGGGGWVTKTGMLAIDKWEDLEKLCEIIAWCWRRAIPVVLMERQTCPVYPMIWDLDAKCKGRRARDVPKESKNGWPWGGRIDFCRWDGADDLFLDESFVLLRHFGYVLLRFFPNLPHIDLCIFNASGWDRVDHYLKVSLHLVAHEIFVNGTMMKAIRDEVVLHFEECSRRPDHPIQRLHDELLAEDPGNRWEEVVDDTTTNDGNGLRMPYCDKAKETPDDDAKEVIEQIQQERRGQPKLTEGQLKRELQQRGRGRFRKEEAGRPCVPIGILRLSRPGDDDLAEAAADGVEGELLPRAAWHALEEERSIEDWMRLGRCRCRPGTPLTPWTPPVGLEPRADVAVTAPETALRASPVIRRFDGDCGSFRRRFDLALQAQDAGAGGVLQGRWLRCPAGVARWRGGLPGEDGAELRFVESRGAVVLLCEPAQGAGVGLVFVKLRNVLAGWTQADDVLCASPESIPAVRFPSPQCRSLERAVDMVIRDEPLSRIVISEGVYRIEQTVVITKPVRLEGEGQWLSRLHGVGCAALRFEGAGLGSVVRNLFVEMLPPETGTWDDTVLATVKVEAPVGDAEPAAGPTITNCKITCATAWGACVRATGGAPRLIGNRITDGGWGVVLVDTTDASEVAQNEILGVGEDGIVVVGGAPKVVNNKVEGCGGAAIRVCGQTCCTLEDNKFVGCLVGFRMLGKNAVADGGPDPRISKANNHLRQNGTHLKGQQEIPAGRMMRGAKFVEQWNEAATARVPEGDGELLQALRRPAGEHTEEQLKQARALIMAARLRAWRPALEARWAPPGEEELARAQRRAADAQFWWREAADYCLRLRPMLQVCCQTCAGPVPLVRQSWQAAEQWECAGLPGRPCPSARQGGRSKRKEDAVKARMACPLCDSRVCLPCAARAEKALPRLHAPPMGFEAAVVCRDWGGPAFGPHCVWVRAGDVVGVDRAAADPEGRLVAVELASGARGWCDPVVLH